MASQRKGLPEGASVIIPRLYCHDVDGEIEFCCEALGAVEAVRRPGPSGRAQHAMLLFGPAMLMIEAENPEVPTRPPNPDGSSPVVIYLYVEDVDATVERAVKKGAKLVVPLETHFWGDRIGWVQDPFWAYVDNRHPHGRDHRESAPRALVQNLVWAAGRGATVLRSHDVSSRGERRKRANELDWSLCRSIRHPKLQG
jgi:PhnB protein